MKIAICDDEEFQRKALFNLCEDFAEVSGIDLEYVEFSSGEELLAYTGDKIALLLLDIDLGGISGLKVLRQIEQDDRFWRVVFVSSHTEMILETFGIKTLDFGVKPIDAKKIEKWISIAERELRENKLIKFEKFNQDMWIYENDIFYLKAAGNYVKIVTANGEKNVSHNIKYWGQELSLRKFIRIHKSYIVNFEQIKEIESNSVLLNGETLPIGRAYRNNVRNAYEDYKKRIMKGRL